MYITDISKSKYKIAENKFCDLKGHSENLFWVVDRIKFYFTKRLNLWKDVYKV